MASKAVTGVVVPEGSPQMGELSTQGASPLPGSTAAHCSATVPAKPAVGIIVMVELPVDPASTVAGVPVIV